MMVDNPYRWFIECLESKPCRNEGTDDCVAWVPCFRTDTSHIRFVLSTVEDEQ